MITDADVKKLQKTFATRDDLKLLELKLETKIELKAFASWVNTNKVDKMLDSAVVELIRFIGETKDEIIKELHDFRVEMRDINRSHQLAPDNT